MRKFWSFVADEGGAVTIDWVAVTSGILLLGFMVVYSIFDGGVSTLVSGINSDLVSTGTNMANNLSGDPPDNTGNASDKACVVTGKFVVCMGPK